MDSPIRTERDDKSRLGALTPIVHVIKNAQTNASRDFDRFYGNLWAKLTPRTTNSRILKRTPDTNDRIRDLEDEIEECNSTSLTPLIERHSLHSESDIAETPGLEAETPHSFSSVPYQTPRKTIVPQNPKRSIAKRTIVHNPRRSVIDSATLTQKIAEERKRMDILQSNVSRIKRQSSFLAEEPSGNFNLIFEEEEEEDEFMPITEPNKSTPNYNRSSFTPMKRHLSPTKYTPSYAKRMAVSPTTTKKSKVAPNKRLLLSPKRIVIEDIPTAKLRSTEMISTPGGSMVSNRFWKEIHGNHATPSPATNRSTPITQRISTLKEKSNSQTWANDEQFWSAESHTPVVSSFTNKLFKVAQQEENRKNQQRQQKENDMIWSSEAPVSSSVKLFKERGGSASPTPSLFNNPLFKAARQDKPIDSFSEKLLRLAQENSTEEPDSFNQKLMQLAKDNGQHSLSDELESAKKRDEIIKRNNIPV
ncbi:hypothetical protein INT48_005763 [Thamnidium elegans]|uniref:Uncharacterized protein n=1 Tax=Thamnidium elegans TaxID=101142 RepID=A0A8H7SVZ2_9FUNG|nr:hypothetical protein INT48_005763 [Thamnidium elegans]